MTCLKDNFDIGAFLDSGRFETIAPLNHGSFGRVFMAKDLQTNETVAIKCLTKSSWSTDSNTTFAVDEKSEELLLHSRLGLHPNIVNILHSFETSSHVFLVLEFCPRGDLYEAIRNGQGPIETERVRQAMLELVDAVSFMHSQGIYHRDIKPENIFLTQLGSLKLGDFGLATTEQWTFENTVGSDRYMAPEQYDSAGAGYSPAHADIWAIGICLLNILFSRNPFTTPTEADPLFLDFSRDRQSLFDIFPSMSLDTYEVIVECMSLDPQKRSLVGARRALLRAVSFTILDEVLDDYCNADLKPGASSNREPLRTPSVQSPLLNEDVFPWTKAVLLNHPQPIQRLAAIPDDEDYSEDLFALSEKDMGDWCSTAAQTPSMSSILNSQMGASVNAQSCCRPTRSAMVSPTASSLPIAMNKRRNVMTILDNRKPSESKSWNDMWYDDMLAGDSSSRESDDGPLSDGNALNSIQEQSSRTWSQESQRHEEATRRFDDLAANKLEGSESMHMGGFSGDIDSDHVHDGFFFQDLPVNRDHDLSVPRYSPAPRRGNVDKWAALGDRRRAFNGTSDSERSPVPHKMRRKNGSGSLGSHGPDSGTIWDNLSQSPKWTKDRIRERGSWVKTRDWDWNWRKEETQC